MWVTFDRDFGALAFRHGVSAPAEIVLLRFVPATPEGSTGVVVDLLSDSGLMFSGKFTVSDRERVRQRSLQGESKSGYHQHAADAAPRRR
jgi:predicted nuclease of predicted toxin-antitoxin system